MLTLQDCLDYANLSSDEVSAIAEHEHVPEVVAAELAAQWVQSDSGCYRIVSCMIDNIEHAQAQGDRRKALDQEQSLHHFVQTHVPDH
ncbi:MAG: hypothetical protein KF778_17900 [Rhodocyclaceae bacterium]|nr:hypothetical protein [Rhodocyclaceae bacterium]MBX3670278.1 hypothetical protein [Rhodocyclaceae bacterium]